MDLANFRLIDDETPPVPTAQVSMARAFGLRQYQGEAVSSVEEGFSEPDVKRQLVSMATGCGKTICFSALASLERDRGGRTLILAHTDELIDQAIDKLRKSTGLRAAKEKAHHYASRFEQIVVGSVQTLCGDVRLSMWKKDHFSRIIVDEGHRILADSYQKILNHFDSRVVAFTATPDRGDRRSLAEYIQRVAYDYGLLHACRDGWLIRPLVEAVPLSIDLRGVKTKKTADGADLDRMEVSHRLAPFLSQIAAEIKARSGNRKILVFLPSVETAQMMAAAFNVIGVPADWVCGDKKICPDRKQRIDRHKAGQIRAMCNMALLTEGYDDDAIECLVVLRPTKIRSLYAQMIGRGTRPLSSIVGALNAAANAAERLAIIKASPKNYLQVLDFLFLYEKHDLIRPANLVAPDEKVAKEMGEVQGDLIEAEQRAERDLLKKLEEEVQKNAHRKGGIHDPLAFATETHDFELASYEPETKLDAAAPTEKQLRILAEHGIQNVRWRGQASAIIAKIQRRQELGLSNYRQMNFLRQLGIDASTMRRDEAQRVILEHGGVR